MRGYRIADASTGKDLDNFQKNGNKDVIVTPFLITEGSRKAMAAIKRDGCWFSVSYPGFEVRPGETIHMVRVYGGY